MNSERTLVLVKPDGVRRGLVGEVISRIEAKGYAVVALRMLQADHALLERLPAYASVPVPLLPSVLNGKP